MFCCKLCDENFRRESGFKSHKGTVWCNDCQEKWDCKVHHLDVMNVIRDEVVTLSTRYTCNRSTSQNVTFIGHQKPETKGDETYADEDQTVADILFEELLKLIMQKN